MIDWVNAMGQDWGHWVRKAEAKHGQVIGTLGRIMDEGLNGAAIRAHGWKIPCVDFPEDIAEFHRAWLQADRDIQSILWVHYKLRKGIAAKMTLMDKKKNAYYRALHKAQATISYKMVIAA